uniref:Dpy-19 like C-mannosyltransferase 3 n=1 Tax=Anas platyrhynchos TaxID=8839 RepID=A0A8B9TEI8_ANAPL
MTTVRQRRGGRVTEGAEDQPSEEKNVKSDGDVLSDHTGGRLWNILSITLGGIVAIGVGLLTSFYVATLHENDLWFSNIKIKNHLSRSHAILTDGHKVNQATDHVRGLNTFAEGMICNQKR